MMCVQPPLCIHVGQKPPSLLTPDFAFAPLEHNSRLNPDVVVVVCTLERWEEASMSESQNIEII